MSAADVRIAIIGDAGVGKTSLLLAFTRGPEWSPDGPVVKRLPPVSIAPEAIAANSSGTAAAGGLIRTTLVDTSGTRHRCTLKDSPRRR